MLAQVLAMLASRKVLVLLPGPWSKVLSVFYCSASRICCWVVQPLPQFINMPLGVSFCLRHFISSISPSDRWGQVTPQTLQE